MLVVRVKRNREDDPADTICLVEGNNDQNGGARKRKKVAFGDLSVRSTTTIPPVEEQETRNAGYSEISNRLILKRVSTIDRSSQKTTHNQESALPLMSKKTLDEDTISLLRKRNEEDLNSQAILSTPIDDPSTLQRKRTKVIIAQNKRALPIEGSESCIIVDMMQMFQPTPPHLEKKENTKPSVTKILDPATRLLRQGILNAMNRNDFNDISSALIKGADANYRLDDKDGGYTALMVAAMKGNVRMVKRLLLNQVDVFVQNKDGATALDLVKKPTRSTQNDCDEIKQTIQQAMMKAHYQRKIDVPSSRGQEKTAAESDYVYDVYCVDGAFSKDLESHRHTSEGDNNELMGGFDPAIVKIDGLKILEDGQVELFQYDSDWSDLADDEDPDSNDERYYANDYPDEDSGDENGGRYFDNDDDDASYSSDEEAKLASKARYRHSAPTHTSRTSKYTNLTSYSDKKRTQRRERFNDVDDEDEDDIEGENALIDAQLEEIVNQELGGGSTNIFDRHLSVGKVLKPHYIGGRGGGDREQWSEMDPPRHLDSETLRQLWGEDVVDDSTLKSSQQQRVYDMRQRTNMLFASNPREFDADGLPRFGAELSDDEANHAFTDATMVMDEDERPDRSAVAYDPDLDRDSD